MKDTDDEQRWIQLNTLFHYSLYEYSGQKKLCDMIENLRIATNTYVHIIVRNARESGRADSGHQDILDACRERDVARAQEAVRTHLNNTVRHTVELIENLPSGESE